MRVSHPAIQNMDFCIEKGETFGLVGPIGAGKSTKEKNP
jgi:ABC-type multidrug transport system ATPase subunit